MTTRTPAERGGRVVGSDDAEPDPESVARTIALRRLTVAPQTRAQLDDAMRRRGVPDDVRHRVLDRFGEVGLIDDAMFARAWVESRHTGRGLAKRALAFELRRRGVEPSVVDQAVSALPAEQEEQTARALVAAKLASTRMLDPTARTRRLAGMLARKRMEGGGNSEHMLAIFQNYDYLNNRAFELGGQAISAGLLSRFGTSESRYRVDSMLALNGIILGATKSDYPNQTSRSYDYGPGLGARLGVAFKRDDWELLRLSQQQFVIHSINGTKSNHYLSLSSVGVSLPIHNNLVLDAEYQLYLANRHYADFPDVAQRSPQLLFGARTRL